MNIFKQGFTLIELLVVIAIIAIITSIGVANLLTAQKQARDAARRELIGNVQSAFEQYYAEFSSYPVGVEASAFETGILPTDPKNTGIYVVNWSNIDANSYCVCATLESGTGNAIAPTSTACDWSASDVYYCAQNKQ